MSPGQGGSGAWHGVWSFLSSVPPCSSTLCLKDVTFCLGASPPACGPASVPAALVGCKVGGECLTSWRRAGSCAVTHLGASAAVLGEGP